MSESLSYLRRLKDAVAENLPYDLVYSYMLRLDGKSLQEACNINPAYKKVCEDSKFWSEKIIRDYPGYTTNCTSSSEDKKQCWIKLYLGTKFEVKIIIKVERFFNYNFKFESKNIIESFNEKLINEDEFKKNAEQLILKNYTEYFKSKIEHNSKLKLSNTFACSITKNGILSFILVKTSNHKPLKGFTGSEKDFILSYASSLVRGNVSPLSEKYIELDGRSLYYDIFGNISNKKDSKDIKVEEERFLAVLSDKEPTYDEKRFVPNPKNFEFIKTSSK